MYELPYGTFLSLITMYIEYFICMRLMNDLRYGQLSNSNWSLKLVLMQVGNNRELLQYLYYLGQGFYRISFVESISSNIEGK